MKIYATKFDLDSEQKRLISADCKYIISQANEIIALLKTNNSTISLNTSRLFGSVEGIKDALDEIYDTIDY